MDSKRLRVVGPPRSGTNYVKFLIESSTELEVGYNVGWWKHAIIPPLMHEVQSSFDETPTVILWRDPLIQMAAFFKFAFIKGTAIRSDADTFSNFIRGPIITRTNYNRTFWYPNPVSYYIQFYWAALSWDANKVFLHLESIKKNPQIIFSSISKLPSTNISPSTIHIDARLYMCRNADKPRLAGWKFDNSTTVAIEDAKNLDIIKSASQEDREFILCREVQDLIKQLSAYSLMEI